MDKRIIEETPSSEVLNDDWFIKDSPTGGTSKILGSKLKEIISGDVEDSIDKILDSIAPEWSSTFTYGYDAYVIYEGELWRCFKDTGSTRGEFKTSEWIKGVTSGYITHVIDKIADRFVASNPPFMTYRYSVGDMVFYSEPYHDEQLYVCNTDLPQGESTFNPEHWDVVYTVAGLSKYLMDKIAEAGQIDDVQVKTTGDYESVVDENKVAKIDLSNMLIEKSVPNLPQPIATFNDGSDLPLKSLTVSIEPVQAGSGDPSPTNVRPITGWTEEVVSVCGKNFLPSPKNGTYSGNGIEATVNDGVITITGTTNASGNAITIPLDHPIELKSGMYLHYMNDVVNTSLAPSFELSTDVSGTSLSYNFSSINRIAEIPSTLIGKKWDRIRFYIANNVNCNCVFSPMLMMSNSASQYEPYAGTTTTIPFVDGQGQSVEVFGGSVDVVNGGGQPQTLGKIIVDENTDINIYSGWRFYYDVPNFVSPASNVVANILCNKLTTRAKNSMPGENAISAYDAGFGRMIISVNNTITTVEDMKEWLANNPLEIVYPLATPTNFYTQPTAVKSVDGENNVSANTGQIEDLEYIANATDVIANLEARVTALENQ